MSLLSYQPANSIFIVNNASYHNITCRKEKMRNQMLRKDLEYELHDTKQKMYCKINENCDKIVQTGDDSRSESETEDSAYDEDNSDFGVN